MNLQGESVLNKSLLKDINSIDINHLSKGIYFGAINYPEGNKVYFKVRG